MRSSTSLAAAALLAAGLCVDVAAGALVLVVVGGVVVGDALVSLSRARVFAWTGLVAWEDGISSSLFWGELIVLPAPRTPGREPVVLAPSGRPRGLVGANDKRPLEGREGAVLVLEVVDETDACRVVLEAGTAGGPIDGRPAPTDGRGFMPRDGPRAFEGVPVREVDALEVAVAICFVGDFVGDYDHNN